MMLLSLHVFAISTLAFVVGGIAFHLGKQEGIRLTKEAIEEQSLESKNRSRPS